MKNKILKILTVLTLLTVLTITNFIYIGKELVSYAVDGNDTVNFKAQLNEGENLLLSINAPNSSNLYNGVITLKEGESNFKFATSQNSQYIKVVEDRKIVLNTISAGTNANIDLKIEPIKDVSFDIGLLDMSSKLYFIGEYKDNEGKDKTVSLEKEVKYEYAENNSNENIESTAKIITNKIVKVSGEDKRVVQLEMNLGLKENNYPIKEIELNLDVPSIISDVTDTGYFEPDVKVKVDFNTMTHWKSKYEDHRLNIKFTNEASQNNKVEWKKQGSEKVVISFIFDKDAKLNGDYVKYINPSSDADVGQPRVKVILYNGKELNSVGTLKGKDVDEKYDQEQLVEVTTSNVENTIYKGKLNSGIDREYKTKTNIAVNLANAEDYIEVREDNYYIARQDRADANVEFNKTIITKKSFEYAFGTEERAGILGTDGKITFLNEKNEELAVVDKNSILDTNDIVIDYSGKEVHDLIIKTTAPEKEGNISFTNVKTLKEKNRDIIRYATELDTHVFYDYIDKQIKESTTTIKLEDTKSEAKISSIVINNDEKNTNILPVVTKNNLKINVLLRTDSERYNLYSNPIVKITLPEDIEKININSVNLVHEEELKVQSCQVNGKTIVVQLQGVQQQYKTESLEGTIVAIDTDVELDRKAATKNGTISMECTNLDETITDEKEVKLIAPKSVTPVNGIAELNIETIGEEEEKSIILQKGVEAKQLQTNIEIINNNQYEIRDVVVMGTFPTNSPNSNADIKILNPITLNGLEGAQIYYTENENATDNIQMEENGWNSQITDTLNVKKYLIKIASLSGQSSIIGTYKFEVPELLEYNKKAELTYTVKYIDSLSGTKSELNSTKIKLETGIGPILEVKLFPYVGKKQLNENEVVKVGEVIKYKIEVSNTGDDVVGEAIIKADVPENTTLVIPKENYEYTGTSYYQESQNKTLEATIKNIPAGKVVSKEYEVRVNNDVPENPTIFNQVKVQYGDVTKKSNESKLKTKGGSLRVTVKRVTDRDIDLYENGSIRYFAIIENTSDNILNSVLVKTGVPECMRVKNVTLLTGMKAIENLETESQSGIQSQDLVYSDKMNIGSLQPRETKVLSYDMSIEKIDSIDRAVFYVEASFNNTEYNSNVITDNIKKADVSLNMTSKQKEQYVKSGDKIEYVITIQNNATKDINGVVLKDKIPEYLTVEKVLFDEEEVKALQNVNNITMDCSIKAGSESTITIQTAVKYLSDLTNAQSITNIAYAEFLDEIIAQSEAINNIIRVEDQNDVDNGDSGDGQTPGEQEVEPDKENNLITGVAWFDNNADGKRDNNEEILSDVKVRLLNIKTNDFEKDEKGNTIETTTNKNGIYVLDHIKNGKYIAIFDYDKTKYAITKYKASGVEQSKNSSAMITELAIGNQRQQVVATDIIEIENRNISDINIGLIELKDFSFKLDKYVKRVLIQDSKGSTINEYTEATLAKAELDAKNINGATVIIEYEIKVTNIGEVEGSVRKIVDYMPKTLKFNSELNKDWYQAGENVYNISLANEKIPAGQSRTVKITLTKDMTENSTGLINNTAEIESSYNDLGINDTKSVSGNKIKGEADFGSADVILGIKTGGEVYITISVIVVAILGITVYIIAKKKNKGEYKI